MSWLGDIFDTSKISGWDALIAILILIAAFILAHFAKKAVGVLATRFPGLHPELVSLSSRIVKYAIILLAVGIDLALLGANIQPLLAAVILVTAIGFLALRGIAANFGAAIIIQSRRSIHLGQEIEVLDYIGTVTQLNSRAVVVVTRDGRTIHIPNVDVLSNPWVNHSERGSRRTSIEVRVAHDTPTLDVTDLLIESASAAHGVHSKHPVSVVVRSRSPHTSTFEVRVWHAPLNEPVAASSAVTAMFDALSAAGHSATVVWPIPVQPLTTPPNP